ncbi:hypothetical protein [Rahnella laticis]|uniref:Cell envelope biogenesis protein TolA n=1 Tax=Rahnella laticis TaxID=2787622 RepID=A0ABS0DZS6_9GAMM|nr:hypothetical protein [Rahnella laticis]MBF7978081.1 hypothetical protein [Rahnella laticis]MBF7998202.1 hypothetical protein [Rahnella sp. LAC-M12]
MSETTELSVIEIKPEQAPALYVANGLDGFLDQIRSSVNEVPDLSTAKGRARIASLSASVSRSKTAIEKPGRELLKKIKEQPKIIEAELRRFITECDTLRDKVRLPLTEWEAEQEKLAAEKQMQEWHEQALADNEAFDQARIERFEADHELAVLMNTQHDRDAADAKAEAERQRIAHEEELKRQAVEQAQREAAATAQREREAAIQREADLKAQAALAEANLIAAEKKAEQDRIDAANKAEADRLAAAQQAEREKQEAIAAEQLKAKQKEDARLAEEKRIAEEAAARAASVEHKRAINQQAVADLVAAGITEECAVQCVKAIAKGQVSAIAITY